MTTRKKRRQRTAQLFAASALLASTVSPYVIEAEEISSTNTNSLQDNIENATAVPYNTVTSLTTGDTTTIDTAQVTAFDKLEAGPYHIKFLIKNNGKIDSAGIFGTYSSAPLPAQIEVTADGKYNITLHVNRNGTSGTYINNITLEQQGQTIVPTVLHKITRTSGLELPTAISFTLNNLNEALTIHATQHTGSSSNFTVTEAAFTRTIEFGEADEASNTVVKDTTITATTDSVLPDLSQLQDGVYEVELEGYSIRFNQLVEINTAQSFSVLPKATLEIKNGKYFITAQFKGVNNEAYPIYSFYTANVHSAIAPWASTTRTSGKLLHVDNDTRISTIKFEIADPFTYSVISDTRYAYNAEVPGITDGTVDIMIKSKPETLKKIGEVSPVAPGNYTTDVIYRELKTDYNVSKTVYSLGQQAAIQLTENKAIVTVSVTDNKETFYKLSTITSPYLKQELKDANGVTYAVQFELPSIDTLLPIDVSLLNQETKAEEKFQLSLDLNDATLTQTDELLQFSPASPDVPFEFPYEDGEYSVDVRLLTDSKTGPLTKDAAASKNVAFEDAKITVKDGKIVFSGTFKNLVSSTYPINIQSENQYGSYQYSPVTVTKEINPETDNYNQDVSFALNDLDGLTRLIYSSQNKKTGRVTGPTTTRLSLDLDSIKPYISTDAGVDLPYTITPDTTDEMGEFIANYLSPYFEKPAKFKVEDGQPYAYVTVSGKMYVADAEKFRFVAANGQEYPVKVVSDNGKTGQELVRVVKFPIHQKQMKLFIDSSEAGYGSYYLYLNADLDKVDFPEELPEFNPSEWESTTGDGEGNTTEPGDGEGSTTEPGTGEEAKEEWLNLDGHQKKFVSKALQRIEENGSDIGDALGKKRNIDLTGYRKVRLRKLGIRIVYKVVNGAIEVTEIVAIGDREGEEVYREAFERILKREK